MKILIGYPPTTSEKGTATLGQNRQFQWFANPTLIYPIVLASAATMLKKQGHDVLWLDAIAENISKEDFFKFIFNKKPDLFVFETKAPVIRQHWKLINEMKEKFPSMKIALCGDHVTSFPKESMENSKVDYVFTGGDYDFVSKELVDYLEGSADIPEGVWYREKGEIKSNGLFKLRHNLDEAPFIDRDLTKWWLYQKEYNLQGRPFMYIMSGRDCWWGRCKFCAWPRLYPRFRSRSVKNVLDEIEMLVEKYNVKEIFDDSGTLRVGPWLKELCEGLIERGLNKKIKYSCNMRFGALSQEEYNLMKKAGFRLLKFGLESANQESLDRMDKGIKVKDIVEGCEMATKAGLTVHLTMIVGWPWETKEDALNTFKLAKWLMQTGRADVLQATVLVPYPGTPIWNEALKNNWFLFDPYEYERYDMSEPVLKVKGNAQEVAKICGKIYTIFLTPQYVWQRAKDIKNFEDLKFNLRGIGAVVGHLKDFLIGKKQNNSK